MVSTVSMTSTVSTQPASKFFTYRPHHTQSVSIAAYLRNMYSPLPLTKVPPGHCASVCLIPLIKCQHQPYLFSISYNIGVHWVDPMIELILAVHGSPFIRSFIIILHFLLPILCLFPMFTIRSYQQTYYPHA